jgi:hypothetical protein
LVIGPARSKKCRGIAIIKSNQGGWRTATAHMDLDTTVTLRTMEEQRREYVQRALHRFVHGLVGILSSSYSSRQRPRPSLSYVVHKPPHHSAHIKRTGELTTARSYFEAVPSERADRCEMGSRSDKTLPEMSMDEKMSLFDGYRVVRSRGTRNGG